MFEHRQLALLSALVGLCFTACADREVREIDGRERPALISVQSEEQHHGYQYYITSIEFLYQISAKRTAPAGFIFAYLNYGIRTLGAADLPMSKVQMKLVT